MEQVQRRRASVHTVGCRLNQAESQTLRDLLTREGYEMVPWGETADLGILNTCTVTREADTKCRKLVRSFIDRNPTAFTAVIGCYSQMGAQTLAAIPGIDLIVGNNDKFAVLDHARLGKNPEPTILRDRIDAQDFSLRFVGDLPFDQRANLKIQDGCDFYCSFCIIPTARGRARSRDWENLHEEARAAVGRGVRELILTGVNLGTYASGGRSLTDVVDALAELTPAPRLRISSIEPTTVDEALLDRMADPAHPLMPFLHLPLQAGCDRTLEKMRRKYTTQEYAAFAEMAAARVPDLCLGTDIMVGHAGETEEDFAETCAFFERLPFAYAHVFPFSERDGTLTVKRLAHDGETVVPVPERQRRGAVLRRLSDRKRRAFMAAQLGQTREVLLENPRDGRWPGYTDNYIRVVCPPPDEQDWRNRLVRVRLDRVTADFVEGTILAEVEAPQPTLAPD